MYPVCRYRYIDVALKVPVSNIYVQQMHIPEYHFEIFLKSDETIVENRETKRVCEMWHFWYILAFAVSIKSL